jgi:hypothetical protein
LEILTKVRLSPGQHLVIERIRSASNGSGQIANDALILILIQQVSLTQYEAAKVANFFNRNGLVQLQYFEEYYRKCVQIKALNSGNYQKFMSLVKQPSTAESVARNLLA